MKFDSPDKLIIAEASMLGVSPEQLATAYNKGQTYKSLGRRGISDGEFNPVSRDTREMEEYE